jgi:hypothetical protein
MKRHNAVRGHFRAPQAAPYLEPALTGDSILLIQLLTFLSTNVQSLEPSTKGSMKLGQTKFDFYLSFRYRLLDSFFWLSNLVTMVPRASRAIMDSNLHVSSYSNAG